MATRVTRRTSIRLRADVACRSVGGEFYALTADNAFHAVTDPVGAFVLGLVEARPGVTIEELADEVERGFDTAGADVRLDLRTFVRQLLEKGLLEPVR